MAGATRVLEGLQKHTNIFDLRAQAVQKLLAHASSAALEVLADADDAKQDEAALIDVVIQKSVAGYR